MQSFALVALCVVASVAFVSASSVQGWTHSRVGVKSCAIVCRVANVAPQRLIFHEGNFEYVQSLFTNTSVCKKYIRTPVDFAPAFNAKTGDCYVVGSRSSTTASSIPAGVQRLCCCSSKSCPVQPAVPLPPPAFTLGFHGKVHEDNKTETIEGRTWVDYFVGSRTEAITEDGSVGYYFADAANMSLIHVDPFMSKYCISGVVDGNVVVSSFPFLFPYEAFETAFFIGVSNGNEDFKEPAQYWYIDSYWGINIKTLFVWTIEARPRPLYIRREFEGSVMEVIINSASTLEPQPAGFYSAPPCNSTLPN